MYIPIHINWTSPFSILGLLGGIFHFNKILNDTSISNNGEPDHTPHFAATDLVLHGLPMSHKRTLDLYGLIHLNRMEFPTLINRASPYPFKGWLVVPFFNFQLNIL